MNAMADDQIDDAELDSISGGWDYSEGNGKGCPNCGFTFTSGGARTHYCMGTGK